MVLQHSGGAQVIFYSSPWTNTHFGEYTIALPSWEFPDSTYNYVCVSNISVRPHSGSKVIVMASQFSCEVLLSETHFSLCFDKWTMRRCHFINTTAQTLLSTMRTGILLLLLFLLFQRMPLPLSVQRDKCILIQRNPFIRFRTMSSPVCFVSL